MPRKKSSAAVRKIETTIDPRQPSLLEKKRNMRGIARHALCLRRDGAAPSRAIDALQVTLMTRMPISLPPTLSSTWIVVWRGLKPLGKGTVPRTLS